MSASNGSDGRVGTTGGTTHFVCLRCGAVDAGDHGCGGIADVEVETRLNPRLISESETEREQLETEQALKTLAALVEAFELVLVAQAREDAVRGQCVEIARRAARATTGYTKTTALFIAQRIEEARAYPVATSDESCPCRSCVAGREVLRRLEAICAEDGDEKP